MVSPEEERAPATFVISGGGIVGLVLALALNTHVGIKAEVYEKGTTFHDDVGAGMGMFPNGLRVLRDISPQLLEAVREVGRPFLYRRWAEHDGAEIMAAEEKVLHEGDEEVQSIGIGRWRLHKVLYDAVQEAGIPVHFGKRTTDVHTNEDGLVEVAFDDGTSRRCQVLFGADGTRSKIREVVAGSSSALESSGVTCLMGISDCAKPDTGVCCPSSTTTKCHAIFFPTLEEEQCFQFYFPFHEKHEDTGNWGTLSEKVGKEECHKLAEKLRQDGWHERYLKPLEEVTHAVRIGFCSLQPYLSKWVHGSSRRIVLLGDAAHPPIPYTGQGAQMGLEDAGTIALLLKQLCVDDKGSLNLDNLDTAMSSFEKMRIPRAAEVQKHSNALGEMQQKRAEDRKYARKQKMLIQREVFFHQTLPIMIPGAQYDYKKEIEDSLMKEGEVHAH